MTSKHDLNELKVKLFDAIRHVGGLVLAEGFLNVIIYPSGIPAVFVFEKAEELDDIHLGIIDNIRKNGACLLFVCTLVDTLDYALNKLHGIYLLRKNEIRGK